MKIYKLVGIFLLLIGIQFISSCGIYSFTGASISPEIKTFSVETFRNASDQVIPSLAEDLTEALKEKFIRELGLSYVPENGDIRFQGSIQSYTIAPAAIAGNEKAATSRLSMTVKVHFENTIEPENNFDATFSNYVDFDSQQNLSSIQDDLHKELIEFFVQDIFNRSVNNW